MGPRVIALWEGRWEDLGDYPSQSEADLALCGYIARETGPDAQQIDALFRESGLFRPKWDEPHYSDGKTYGQATIERAISKAAPAKPSGGVTATALLDKFISAADLTTSPPRIARPVAGPYVMAGCITKLDGKAKLAGKTTLLAGRGACHRDRRSFLGYPAQRGPVVYLSEQSVYTPLSGSPACRTRRPP